MENENNIKKRRMLVVFDIDETLIQYIPGKYRSLFEQKKSKFPQGSYVEDGQSIILFRPGLEQMMNLFAKDTFFVPALWTYSENEYCNGIAEAIIKRFNLPEDIFLFKKGAEDIDDEIPKNLKAVYEEYPEFNCFNTILIDDRYGNINNESNVDNGLCIQPFAPFGAEKIREILPSAKFDAEMNDSILSQIMYILKDIKNDIEGCDNEDYQIGFDTEPVFCPKRIKRMGLEKFVQTYAVKFQDVISVGTPYLTNKFILIKDYNEYPKKMGGFKKTKRHKKKLFGTIKNKKNYWM
jgi:NLI interacting factor-like phosphatase